jgi:hypothetical protein
VLFSFRCKLQVATTFAAWSLPPVAGKYPEDSLEGVGADGSPVAEIATMRSADTSADAAGRVLRTFSSEPGRSVEDLAWLADGRLAFAVNRVNFGVELVIADVSGKEQVAATRPGAFAHKIAVAPDDSLFAIQLDDRIVVFDAQGALRSELDGTLQGWRPTG